MNNSCAYYNTPLGLIKYTYTDKITRIELVKEKTSPEKKTIMTDELNEQINQYLKGVRKTFDLDRYIKITGSEFRLKVYSKLLEIPYGKTVSYADIARSIGNPRSARAVGTAVGANPLMILIPCHRVIKSDGSLGGYHYGLDIKKELLKIEGINF